jgi:hypothetical protein
MPTNCDEPGSRARRALGTVAVAAAALAGACAAANPVEPGARAPAAPLHLRAAPSGPTSVRVTWDLVPGSERYRLERSVTTRPSAYQLLSDTMTAPRYHDRDLNRSLGYAYRVAAVAGERRGRFSDSVVVYLDLSGSAAILPVPHGVSHCGSRGCSVSD